MTLEDLWERLSQLDEERRRIYTALALKASLYSDGRVEIAGHPPLALCPEEKG